MIQFFKSFIRPVLALFFVMSLTNFFSVALAAPTYEVILEKIKPYLGWNQDQTKAIMFGISHPTCAGSIIGYTVAQDYSLVGFIGSLKVAKIQSLPIPPMNGETCKKYNPPQQAYTFIDNQGDKLLGKATADSVRALLKPLIEEGKSSITAEIAAIPYVGTIITNWDCGCDAAFETNFNVEVMADSVVADGIFIGKAAKAGDYATVIEKMIELAGPQIACELGAQLFGTGNIPIVSTIVSSACSNIGKATGWVTGAASTVGQALGLIGYQHIPPEQYYNENWAQHRQGGAQVASFLGGDALFQFEVPIYDGCYDYFSKSNMSNSSATETCDKERAQFSDEVVAIQATLEQKAKLELANAYEIKMDGWRANYIKLCHIDDPNFANTKSLVQKCNEDVDAALKAGKSVAVDAWKSCQLPATFSYDIQKCVTTGYNSTGAARDKALTAVKAENAAYLSQKIVDTIAKSSKEAQQKAMKDDLDPWFSQCPASLSDKCTANLKLAWTTCQNHIALIPSDYGGGEFKKQNPATVSKILLQCQTLYSNLISDYTKFVTKTKSVSQIEPLCKQLTSKIKVVGACKADIQSTTDKCTGGLPKIGLLPNTIQSPLGQDDCTPLFSSFTNKWTSENAAKAKLDIPAKKATMACNTTGLSDCNVAVISQVQECKSKITKQFEDVVSVAAVGSTNLSKATGDLTAAASKCGELILKVPQKFSKGKETEILALQTFAKLCPPNIEKTNFADQCKNEIIKTINLCVSSGSSSGKNLSKSSAGGSGSSNGGPLGAPAQIVMSVQQEQVNDCKLKLQAVVDKYQDQYNHTKLAVGATAEPVGKPKDNVKPKDGVKPPLTIPAKPVDDSAPAPKRKGLMSAPTALGLTKSAPAANGAPKASTTEIKRISPTSPPSAAASQQPTAASPVTDTNSGGSPLTLKKGLTLPAAQPLPVEKQLNDKGCSVPPHTRNATTYLCKTDEGMKLCETFKQDHKVVDCKKAN